MGVFEKVTVTVKAITVKNPTNVGDKRKQDVIIADKTGTVWVSLWEDHVDKQVENSSYYLEITIASIGNVAEYVKDKDECTTIKKVQVIGVPLLDKYKACLQCK